MPIWLFYPSEISKDFFSPWCQANLFILTGPGHFFFGLSPWKGPKTWDGDRLVRYLRWLGRCEPNIFRIQMVVSLMVIYHGRICKQSPTKQIQISSWESKGIYSQCDPPTLEMRPSLGNDHDDKPPFIRQLRYLSKFLSFLKPEFGGHFEG